MTHSQLYVQRELKYHCWCVCVRGDCSEDEEEEVLSCEGGKKSRKMLKGNPNELTHHCANYQQYFDI